MTRITDRKTKRTHCIAAALVASTTVISRFSHGDEIHLINDLGGNTAESDIEVQTERNWNEEYRLRRQGSLTGCPCRRRPGEVCGGHGVFHYDVFADGDEGVAATVVNSFLKKAGRKERARSGSLLV